MDYMEAAMMVFKRKPRFVEGYDSEEEITNIIKKVFGNYQKNIKEGLTVQYKNLKELVIKEKLIGLILLGVDIDKFVINYKTIENRDIEITISGICEILLEEYFTEEEIKRECYRTPNIEIYLKNN